MYSHIVGLSLGFISADLGDNDMSEQQRGQANVSHGQEAVCSPQVQFAIPSTNSPTGLAPKSSLSSNISAPVPGHKKKSSFQITSVIETKARNRGDSNGFDGDLNESDIVADEEVWWNLVFQR